MSARGQAFPALAPLTVSQWSEYALRTVAHRLRPFRPPVSRIWRMTAWFTALFMLALTSAVAPRRRLSPSPSAQTASSSTLRETGADRPRYRNRGGRARPRQAPCAPRPARATARSPAAIRTIPLVAPSRLSAPHLGGPARVAARHQQPAIVPRAVNATDLGRLVCRDPLRRAVVADWRANVPVEDLLELTGEETTGDWRMPASFWVLTRLRLRRPADHAGLPLLFRNHHRRAAMPSPPNRPEHPAFRAPRRCATCSLSVWRSRARRRGGLTAAGRSTTIGPRSRV